ncbi:MAG TPA: ATP-binding protein [Burkholderiales bacterium]|nr:ATP-binding protein [Burkholderiales bacterium]
MSELAGERVERRLLVLAPVGKDASLVAAMLHKEGVACVACPDPESLARELGRGAAAVLVAEEAIVEVEGGLAALIARQPPWSDLPVLLLTRAGADSAAVARAVATLGNVTLLERPVRVSALASAVRSALRARERQYETRSHLQEREQADQRKNEFLATLAHELRNPLAPIRNSVSLLRLSAAGHPQAPVWEMMDRQINHMVRLVDDLMEVSRITSGKIELRKEAVDLAAVIAAAVETNRPLAESAKHALMVTLPPGPLVVEADAVRLAQVFANLLNNAVKYTDAGGRIAIEARREGDSAVVTVTDTGIGISAAALLRVFDMFVQADDRDSRAQGGLGIGLTLVRSLIEMHGGSVTARSAGAGQGSEFVVRLPVAGRAAASEKRTAAVAGEVRGLPRILVVDDNRDAADSLGAVLRMLGAEVVVSHDGQAALDALVAFRPAAVFLDLGMPDMDGLEVARRIRARSDARDIVLIALTGWGQQDTRRQTESAGFSHHLVKPANIDVLQAVLASLARARHGP